MIDTLKLKRYAKRLNTRSENFSAQEKVAYKILDLLDAAHTVSGVRLILRDMLVDARLAEDDELVGATDHALSYIDHSPMKGR